MEAFEHVVKVMLEAQGYLVSTNVKFPITRVTKKAAYEEVQTHGYEIDIVAGRADRLLLGSVKSYFGSRGVARSGFRELHGDEHKDQNLYKLFNDTDLRDALIAAAAKRYGYSPHAVRVALYVGKFASGHESDVRTHLAGMSAGGGPIEVVGNHEICSTLLALLDSDTYMNDAIAVTIRAFAAAGLLRKDAKAIRQSD